MRGDRMGAKQRAFTLVEVLFVIAVCIVFGAIFVMVLPGLREPRSRKRSPCKQNMSQLGQAIFNYNQNFDQYYPFA